MRIIFKVLIVMSVFLFIAIMVKIVANMKASQARHTKSQQMAVAASLTLTDPSAELIPSHINVPSLNIDAEIVKVATKNGQIDMPENPKQVGWYDHTSHPILVGHSGWYDRGKVAFDGLRNIKTGDIILVEYDGGATYMFRADSVQILPRDATLADIFVSDQDFDLQLITCTGNWNASNQTYEQRLIVNASRVSN